MGRFLGKAAGSWGRDGSRGFEAFSEICVPVFAGVILPRHGSTINPLIGATIQVLAPAGAAIYDFVVTQGSTQVFQFSSPQPIFVIPSALQTFGPGPGLQPGSMTVTITATGGALPDPMRMVVQYQVSSAVAPDWTVPEG